MQFLANCFGFRQRHGVSRIVFWVLAAKSKNKLKFSVKYTRKNIERRIIMVYYDYKR